MQIFISLIILTLCCLPHNALAELTAAEEIEFQALNAEFGNHTEEKEVIVECYSGGDEIYSGEATRHPHIKNGTIIFRETDTKDRIIVTADCIVRVTK